MDYEKKENRGKKEADFIHKESNLEERANRINNYQRLFSNFPKGIHLAYIKKEDTFSLTRYFLERQ